MTHSVHDLAHGFAGAALFRQLRRLDRANRLAAARYIRTRRHRLKPADLSTVAVAYPTLGLAPSDRKKASEGGRGRPALHPLRAKGPLAVAVAWAALPVSTESQRKQSLRESPLWREIVADAYLGESARLRADLRREAGRRVRRFDRQSPDVQERRRRGWSVSKQAEQHVAETFGVNSAIVHRDKSAVDVRGYTPNPEILALWRHYIATGDELADLGGANETEFI